MSHVYGVATIVLLGHNFSGDGGENKKFLFLISKKTDRVVT